MTAENLIQTPRRDVFRPAAGIAAEGENQKTPETN